MASLGLGVRLGTYEIVSPLGAGGMGEVYRARDSKLGREVAIKVLPPALTNDPDRLARFSREAQLLASLNHPNIAAIYHVEETADGPAIVMELVEGGTLADRIAHGPIPIDEALPIAKQIAEALDAAHEHGIIHRDLKPANIKVRPDGTVKVLDFGLAKLNEATVSSGSNIPNASMSPTITSPAAMTGVGILMGTAAYMAPEQARGNDVDARADIWAFGCVVYEMLTGKRAFDGEDAAEVLAFVLTKEPDWTRLPPSTPLALQTLLKRCLDKKTATRVRVISIARFVIEEQTNVVAPSSDVHDDRRRPAQWRRVVIPAAALLSAAVIAAAIVLRPTGPTSVPLVRTEMSASGATGLRVRGFDHDVAITPDGSHVVYRGPNELIVRAVDQLGPRVLSDLGEPQGLFVSPDGQWIGFFDGTRSLRKVSIAGGSPVTLATNVGPPWGASWSDDGTIIYAAAGAPSLRRISANGGDTSIVTTPNPKNSELGHAWPEFLPNHRGVLFTILPTNSRLDDAQIAVLDLQTNTQHVLIRGGYDAHYVAGGYLVYGAQNAARAVKFDVEHLAVTGSSVPLSDHILTTTVGALDMAVAANGTLVYVPGTLQTTGYRTLTWVDRAGREESISAPARAYVYPRISPDGTRVAITSQDQQRDLWVWDLVRMTLTRLTFDEATDLAPIWTPDGRRLIFSSGRGVRNLFEIQADGAGSPKRLTQSAHNQDPTSLTPDGNEVIINEGTSLQSVGGGGTEEGTRDIRMLHLTPASTVAPLLTTPFEERGGVVSPDAHYIAYESNSSGRFEIYVRPFPAVDSGQWQISTSGGVQPLWSSDGHELFYLAADGALMSVPVTVRSSVWNAGSPVKVLSGGYFNGGGNVTRQYDVSRDGRRFLMIKDEDNGAAPQNLVFVQSWSEELKRLLPTK
jgi:eukaryotic-like serine/threonine-protein kinase